jgi:hypothetical protein
MYKYHGLARQIVQITLHIEDRMSGIQCFHITTFINTLGLLLMEKYKPDSSRVDR